jgi:hypothetical protein
LGARRQQLGDRELGNGLTGDHLIEGVFLAVASRDIRIGAVNFELTSGMLITQ